MTPLGAELRRIRGKRALSLKEFAEQVGVTPAYLSALEHGHRGVPTDEMLHRILAALQVNSEQRTRLVDLVRISRPKVTIETAALEPEATELANRLADDIDVLSKQNLAELLWRLQDMITHKNEL